MVHNLMTWIGIAILIAGTGCDDRVTQVAREAANRQAQQNTEMADLHQQVAAGARDLVAADAKARGDILGIHHDLQSERTRLDTGWSALESERRQIANQRRTESFFAALVPLLGTAALVILLLGFCWYAVGAAHNSDCGDFRVEEFLVREILPADPGLLNGATDRDQFIGPA